MLAAIKRNATEIISNGINKYLSSFAIAKYFSKIKPFLKYSASKTTHNAPYLLWIQGFALIVLVFFFSSTSLSAQSKKIDSTFLSVDTLIQGKGGIEELVDYSAVDSIILDLESKVAHLYGGAIVKYTDIELQADYIRIDFASKQLFSKGIPDSLGIVSKVPHFKQGDNEFDTDSLSYNFGTKRARLTGLRLQQDESYIICNNVFRNEDGSIITDIGKFTTCNLDHPHFYFKARQLKVIPKDKVVFGPANLVVEDVPTPLFVPFGIFPVQKDRKSGLLFPAPQMGGFRGFGVTDLGWHFHISDYVNLSVVTDLFFGGSYKVGVASEYANRYKYNGRVNLTYGYSIISGSKEENNLQASNDYSVAWRHNEDPKNHPGRTFSANVNLNGGNYNQNFVQNTERFGNSQFNSSINYSKVLIKNLLSLNATASASQNTQTKSLNTTAPSVALTMQRINPFKRKNKTKKSWLDIFDNFGLSYTGNFTNNITRSDSGLFDLNTWEEPWRNSQKSVSHVIPVTMSFSFLKNYFNFTPSFNYRQDWYFQEYRLDYNTVENKVDTVLTIRNTFGVDQSYNFGGALRTNIFGTYNFKKGRIKAIRHAITPLVGFTYTPDFSLPKYSSNATYRDTAKENVYNIYSTQIVQTRKSGQLNFSLANVINGKRLSKDSVPKPERFSIIDQFSLNSGYDILADSLNWSPLTASLNTTLFKRLNFNASASFSPYTLDAFGARKNEFFIKNGRGIVQIQSANIGLSANLNPKATEKRNKELQEVAWENRYVFDLLRRQLLDFSLPWSLTVNANARFDPFAQEGQKKWNVIPAFSGDASISPLWKVTFNSGYDLVNQKIAETTQIGLARSLHCWVLSFDWTPVGERKTFTFILRPQAAMLQDLKLSKRNYWWNLF